MKIYHKTLAFAALCAAVVFLPTASAFAGDDYNRRGDYRNSRYDRVENVRNRDTINRREIQAIDRRRTALEAARERALRDGRVTRQEREQIERLEQAFARTVRDARR